MNTSVCILLFNTKINKEKLILIYSSMLLFDFKNLIEHRNILKEE